MDINGDVVTLYRHPPAYKSDYLRGGKEGEGRREENGEGRGGKGRDGEKLGERIGRKEK